MKFMIFLGSYEGHQISSNQPWNRAKSRPIGCIIDHIEMDRPPNVQISNIKWALFERFFKNATKTSAKAKKCIFLSIFIAADKNHWILVKLPNFIKFLVVLPMSTIVSAKIAQIAFLENLLFLPPKPLVLPEKQAALGALRLLLWALKKP